jgi:hypothetical protein
MYNRGAIGATVRTTKISGDPLEYFLYQDEIVPNQFAAQYFHA